MRIAVLEELREDAELRRRWNELALQMERPEVFYTYEWAQAVGCAYGESPTPFIFLGYVGESLVGIVAFAREKHAPNAVVFLTNTTADYCDFLSEPARRQEFVSAVFSELRRRQIAKITLANLPAESSSVSAIRDAASHGQYHFFSRPAYLCAHVVLGTTEERAVLKQVTANRKMVRRNLNALRRSASVTFRHDTRWEDIEPLLDPFSKAQVSRFLITGRFSNVARKERRVFLHELARTLCRQGWMMMSCLLVDGVPVAWNYGFLFGGSWFWYQPTFSSSYQEFSPGFCLLSNIVETACGRADVDVVDLGLGAEGYKERFATANRQTLHMTLQQAFAGHLQTVLRYRAATAVIASPPAERSIRAGISAVGRLATRLRQTSASGTFRWLSGRIRRLFFAFDEVRFFDWPRDAHVVLESGGLTLRPFDFDVLGAAGIHYAEDPSTQPYLLRSAQRLRSGNDRGFALITPEGMPLHFCWVKDFEGFDMDELGRTLHAPGPGAVMIFDCFTPVPVRGKGLFSTAITALAGQLRASGKAPWIFAAATNRASIRGIEKSGFTYRFSLARGRIFFVKYEKDSTPSPDPANVVAVPSR